MKTFKLPDLGEGLQEAEVIEWKVNIGDSVKVDQVIVIVETAKAIVELPSPIEGTITSMCAAPGDTVNVGEVLVEYEGELVESESLAGESDASVSVVGKLESAGKTASVEQFAIGVDEFNVQAFDDPEELHSCYELTAPPEIIAFAKKLGLEHKLRGSQYGLVSKADLAKQFEAMNEPQVQSDDSNPSIKLSGNKKVMAQTMMKSHQHVPAVTLFDDAVIEHWEVKTDITVRVLQAIVDACHEMPLLNAWFDEEGLSIQVFDDINIGVAVNSKEGLFVPVMREAHKLSSDMMRTVLDKMIKDVQKRSIKPQKLLGATISLSNFGTLSGRYATPIIVPPQVAIIGVGTIRKEPIVVDDEVQVGRVLPLSLSFDHRAATGGDASQFMAAMIRSLEK